MAAKIYFQLIQSTARSLRYTPIEKAEAEKLVFSNRLFSNSDQSVFTAVADPYFRADYLAGNNSKVAAGFSIMLVLEGNGSIAFENHSAIDAVKGDAILIPHSAGSWTLSGASGVVCRPPLAKDSPLAI